MMFDHRAKELEGFQKKHQLTELKLYNLAKQAVPWKEGDEGYTPSGKFEFLAPLTIQGDTWKTFMNYSEKWSEQPRKLTESLSNYLPHILKIEEEEEQNKSINEPTSEWDQPLSRKEFYNFHLERNKSWVTGFIFISFVIGCFFGWNTIWAVFSGNYETLGRDIFLTGSSIYFLFHLSKEFNRLHSEQKKIN